MKTVIYRLDFDCGDGRRYSYWGSTIDFKKRMRQHRNHLRKGKHCNRRVQRTFDKHGDFEESIVMLSSRDTLAEDERCMIVRHYRQDYCLNLTMETISPMRDPEVQRRNAEAVRAVQQTEEWRAATKVAAERRAQCPEWRRNVTAALHEAHSKKVELTFPSGEVRAFDSVSAAAQEIAANQPTLSSWLLGKSPWPGQGKRLRKEVSHLRGISGRYL